MLYHVLEFIGVFAFAISGALAAVNKRLDFSAAVVLAFLVGSGGGTIRDILLHTDIFWFHQTYYIYLTMIIGGLTFAIAYYEDAWSKKAQFTHLLLLCDALGLAVFTVAGVAKALTFGTNHAVAVMLGVLTAVGGGVVRDILCNEVPIIFRGQLYATPALAGAVTYVLILHYFTMDYRYASFSAMAVIIGLRLLGIYRDWQLPVISDLDPPSK